MLLFLITQCLVVAVQPRMEWIPIKYREELLASTSAHKYRLIKLLIFVFVGRYLPSEIQTIKLSHNSESLMTLNQSKKRFRSRWIYLLLERKKFDRMAKSEKLFWFLMTLVAFVITYIFSVISDANRFFDGWHTCS